MLFSECRLYIIIIFWNMVVYYQKPDDETWIFYCYHSLKLCYLHNCHSLNLGFLIQTLFKTWILKSGFIWNLDFWIRHSLKHVLFYQSFSETKILNPDILWNMDFLNETFYETWLFISASFEFRLWTRQKM